MLIHHRPIKTVISGKSGSGKTTYFQRLLENGFSSYWKTVFLYDWQGEMSQRLNMPAVYDSRALGDALQQKFVIFDPAQDFESDALQGFLFFAKWAFEICKSTDGAEYPRLFACDEVQLLLEDCSMQPEIQTIIQTGRRVGLDMAVVAQQLNELNNKFRAQSTERVCFQHEDTYVLQVIGNWGFDPDIVKQLSLGEYLWNNDRGESGRGQLFSVDKRAKPVDTDNGRCSDAAAVPARLRGGGGYQDTAKPTPPDED